MRLARCCRPFVFAWFYLVSALCIAAEADAYLNGKAACRVSADQHLEIPVRTITAEYTRRTGTEIIVRLLPIEQLNRLVKAKQAECDVVLCMAKQEENTPMSSLPGAKIVAWKHPTGGPVWAAVVGGHAEAPDVVRFLGGATGHRERIRAARQHDRIRCAVGNVGDLPFADSSFDAVVGAGPVLLGGQREKAMQEIYRVLRTGGVALVGGRYLGMPERRKVPSETLRDSAAKTGIPSIRVIDDMGQWIEILKGSVCSASSSAGCSWRCYKSEILH